MANTPQASTESPPLGFLQQIDPAPFYPFRDHALRDGIALPLAATHGVQTFTLHFRPSMLHLPAHFDSLVQLLRLARQYELHYALLDFVVDPNQLWVLERPWCWWNRSARITWWSAFIARPDWGKEPWLSMRDWLLTNGIDISEIDAVGHNTW